MSVFSNTLNAWDMEKETFLDSYAACEITLVATVGDKKDEYDVRR